MSIHWRVGPSRGALVAFSIVVVIAAGCGEEPPPPVEVIRPVKILEIGADAQRSTREYPGRIKAGQYSEMSFEVPGKVTEFVYKEGSAVDAGAVLARIDPRDYQAQYDASQAELQHARAERDRFKVMYDEQVKPFAEYELRMRAFEVKEAELKITKKALDDTVLRAPFDGVMARKLVEEYENVLAKEPVLVMQNDDLLELKVNVPERDLAGGRPRDETDEELAARLRPRVVISSLPDREFPARLKELSNIADPTTRTFEATFLFEKPEGLNVLGGMTAKIVIDVSQRVGGKGVLVPASAVVAGDGRDGAVWIVDPSSLTVSRRDVVVGELTGSSIRVESGLELGESIAVSGVHELREGMQIRRAER